MPSCANCGRTRSVSWHGARSNGAQVQVCAGCYDQLTDRQPRQQPQQQIRRCARCGDTETTQWHRMTNPNTGLPVVICNFCYHTYFIEGF